MRKLLLGSVLFGVAFFLFFGKVSAEPNFVPPGFIAREFFKPVCTVSDNITPRCHAKVVTDKNGSPNANSVPSGYGPQQFLSAYNLNATASGNTVIAVVDAYDHPNILSDLNTYSRQFKIPELPSCSSTITTSCFLKVDQNGGTNYPAVNAGWALEISLDVEVAHAICQNCKIILVEASSNSYANLMTAVDTARRLGANVISNSYGSSEFSGETSYDSHFIGSAAITFSSGDSGYGVEYPAASQYVTAVGGTTLRLNPDNTWNSETAWNGSGSGCSAYETKPVWQTDNAGCANRTVADVSAVADPNTGAAVYDSVRYQGKKGWFKVGGTSLASPLIAGVYALSGNYNLGTMYNGAVNQYLRDITGGSNGNCGGSYLCTAVTGYDGPTGKGTPNGFGAF